MEAVCVCHLQKLHPDDSYYSVMSKVTGQARLGRLKGNEDAIVDGVTLVGTGPKDKLQKVLLQLFPIKDVQLCSPSAKK